MRTSQTFSYKGFNATVHVCVDHLYPLTPYVARIEYESPEVAKSFLEKYRFDNYSSHTESKSALLKWAKLRLQKAVESM